MTNLRLAVRQLVKSPAFTAVAGLTLALGIGASAAIFSVVETFLLRPLPYRAPEELVSVQCEMPGLGRANVGTSVSEFEDLRDRADVFAELSMVFPMSGNLTGVSQPQRVEAMAVSPNFFRLLGGVALLGRTFGPEEAKVPGWAEGCVLSHTAWQRYFGGDPAVLGRKIWLDYDTYRVIGIMPPDFRHPGRTLAADVDVWFTGGMRSPPFPVQPQRTRRNIPGMIGRLNPGLTLTAAQVRLEAFGAETRRAFANDYPADSRWTPRLQPLQQQLAGNAATLLWLLFGAVALVLLICCATLANLLLVRAAGRRQELAVRVALGASRGELVRQLCLESAVLALAGGAAGLLLAYWLPPLIVAFAPAGLPRINAVSVNLSVLGFTAAVALATGILCGVFPAWQATRFDVVSSLKEGGGGGGGRATHRWRSGFAAAQIALSLVLLAGGGVLWRSLRHALAVDPGFQPAQVTVTRIWLPPPSDPNARQTYRNVAARVAFMRELQRRIRAVPGVDLVAVGTGQCVPLAGDWSTTPFVVESGVVPADAPPTALLSPVTPDYFSALGIRLLRGRGFVENDDGEQRVMVVSAATADRYWPGQDPLGRRVALGGANQPWWTVVGVVNNVKTEGLDAPGAPHLYVPIYQRTSMGLAVLVRTAAATPATVVGETVRQQVRAIAPDLPVYGMQALDTLLDRSLAPRRFTVAIVGAFALVALVLAGLGVYGVVALSVAQRTTEIGVRMALGADSRQVAALVLRQGLTMTAIGAGFGVVGAVAATSAIRGLLFDTHPADPLTLGAMIGLLAVAALVACWIPAWRAIRVNPIEALRAQ